MTEKGASEPLSEDKLKHAEEWMNTVGNNPLPEDIACHLIVQCRLLLDKRAEVEHKHWELKNWIDIRQAAINELRLQVTKLENELCTAKDQIPPDMDGDSLSTALIKLGDERLGLNGKLKSLMGAMADAGCSVSQPHDVVHHANEIRKMGSQNADLREQAREAKHDANRMFEQLGERDRLIDDLQRQLDEAKRDNNEALRTLKWTTTKPEKPGWYWWVDPGRDMLPGGRLQVAEIVDERTVIFACGQVVNLDDDDLGGQWAGPIEEPTPGG
jgi:hypothetical protein